MGKSNRIRANRAAQGASVMTLNTKPQKKEMPSWLMTVIAIVIAAAILLSVVGIILSANGVFGRWATAVSTKHFKVNANMLSYYYFTQYQSFLEENETYLSYYSLDTSKSLKDQRFGGPEESDGTFYYDSLLGTYEGTWFDYFMDQTVASVSSLLVYCEGAYEKGIKLDDADHEQIDAAIESLEASALQYTGYYANVDSYIADMYGAGVKVKDIRKAMEYSALATKYMSELSGQISDEITDTDVNNAYAKDPLKYLLVDYTYYTFETSYTEAKKEAGLSDVADSALTQEQKDQISAKYTELVNNVKAKADEMLTKTTAEEVNKFVLTYSAERQVKDAWSQQTITVENADAIKAKLAEDIVKEVLDGNTDAENPTAEAGTVFAGLEEGVIGQLVTVKNTAFAEVLSDKEVSIREKVSYVSETDKVSVWAFADGVAVGATNKIEADANNTEAVSGATYSVSSYFLVKAPRPDTDKTRNVAYMLFTDENAAKSAVALMMERGTATLADFEALVSEVGASANTHLEDYVKGNIQSDTFDTWLFADETTVGTYTAAPLKLEDGATYCVALYYAEGHEGWYVSVKNAILTERFDAKVAELEGKFEVTVKEGALKRVDA